MLGRVQILYVPENINLDEMVDKVSRILVEKNMVDKISKNRAILVMLLAGYTAITGEKVQIKIGGEEIEVEQR